MPAPTAETSLTDPTGQRYIGVRGAGRAFFIAELAQTNSKIVVVCKDRNDAEELASDIGFFLPHLPALQFPAWDTLPFENVSPQPLVSAQRMFAARYLTSNLPSIIVTAPDALLQRCLPAGVAERLTFTISIDAKISKSQFVAKVNDAGFQSVSLVEEIGEYAERGGVVDLFPMGVDFPVRVNFEDSNQGNSHLTSLTFFDPDTQRTIDEPSPAALTISPVREIIPSSSIENLEAACERLKTRGKSLETPPREIVKDMTALQEGTLIPGLELIQASALGGLVPLTSLIPENFQIVIADDLAITQNLDQFQELIDERAARLASEHFLIPKTSDSYVTPNEVLEALHSRSPIYLDHLEFADKTPTKSTNFPTLPNTELTTRLKSKVGSGKAMDPLRRAVNSFRNKGCSVAFVVGATGRAERLQRILLEENLDCHIYPGSAGDWCQSANRNPLVILQGHLSSGFQLPARSLVFIAENEVFGERSYRKLKTTRTSLKKLMNSLAQLKEEDFVVHNDYGIGIYRGLKHMEVGDNEGDFLQIDYADSKLYLPVQNINKIQKFSAAEGQLPILDKLSSNRWIRTKQKVKESVITLAGDLIKLYATRSVAKGWRFEPEGAEDERFADGFAYNETGDQLKAISETLKDMAEDKPMDRLICGDVGFGKTEVALRAAYKCTQHARQVAVLVPTTILVEQHRSSFVERFKGYPVTIGAVSRFYSSQENKETLAKLATGEIDIVIGTHRLLSRDVQFKDLGLLIIDEEHRFGVAQKEKLKAMRKNIDVLTLTATPIPRTLHMSLLNIRDISLITTPPTDRKVIRTYVAVQNDTMVRDAILRELQRGGQTFYLHNRVDSIEGCTARLAELIPEARFVFAHGQMSEDELENIMQRFLEHRADVLVTTTIIESGLDIPNANTIIMERADTFGLAQLYQLRGRVGRSTRQAYAYLMIPTTRNLGADAQKRLKVLQSLDDLGLGFNLAINDLEIRGAGNLLGKEQSGNVLAVGFDLFTRILKEAIADLKGDELPIEETIDPEVKLGVNAYIPEVYIPDISERLVLYQRLAALTTSEEADNLGLEIEERFGPLPKEVRNLGELMRLRALFRYYGVFKGEFSAGRLLLSFAPQAKIDAEKIFKLVQAEPKKYKFSKNLTLSVTFDFQVLDSPKELYRPADELLRTISLRT